MKKVINITLSLISALLCLTTYAGLTHFDDNDDPATFLGFLLKSRYTGIIKENYAFSVLGEVGFKNYRVGGTIGRQFSANQRFKLSAEWLHQNLSYDFFTGDTDQWVNQFAFGIGYQFDIPYECYDPAFDLNAYFSHAPSKSLSSRRGTITQGTTVFNFVNSRHIAGSNAAGIAPGISFSAWQGSRVGLSLNYDNVHYNTKFSDMKKVSGFGGTFYLMQALNDHFVLGATASLRQPFNYYAAYFGWRNVSYLRGPWTIGIDAGYTSGKESLSNTWSVGLSFDYLFDPPPPPFPIDLKGNYKCEVPPPHGVCKNPLVTWVADPAVYMPQVLAISEEEVTLAPIRPIRPIRPIICRDGTRPVVISALPSLIILAPTTDNVPTANAFSGKNIVFSVKSTATAPNTVTIHPVTGVVTINAVSSDIFTVTVRATNACGSAATQFAVSIDEDTRS